MSTANVGVHGEQRQRLLTRPGTHHREVGVQLTLQAVQDGGLVVDAKDPGPLSTVGLLGSSITGRSNHFVAVAAPVVYEGSDPEIVRVLVVQPTVPRHRVDFGQQNFGQGHRVYFGQSTA